MGWLVILTGFALLSWNRLNLAPDTAYTWINPYHLHTPSWNPLQLPARWDSEWYLDIATNGYSYKGPHQLSNIAFFPIYPMLIRVLSYIFFGNLVLAGWIVSLVSIVAASVVLVRLVERFHKNLQPFEVLAFALLFPTAIFFTGIYTESLFLLFSVSAFYFARKQQFYYSLAIAALATITRVTGIVLLLPIAIEYFITYKKHWLRKEVLFFALPPLALGSIGLFHRRAFGDALAFFRVEEAFGRNFHLNSEHFQTLTSAAQSNLFIDAFITLVGIIMVYVIAKRVRVSYAAYVAASILVPLSTGTLMSMNRYVLALFPISLAAATFSKPVKAFWLLCSVLLLALTTMLYAHSYWAG